MPEHRRSPRVASGASRRREVDLAGAQRDLAGVGVHQQRAGVVDPAGDSLAVPPADPLARAARRARARRRGSRPRAPRASGRATTAARRAPPRRWRRRRRRASDVAVSRSSGGNSSSDVRTFSPMPTTAQPAAGRPSTRIPESLRRSIQTSFGHLIRAAHRAARLGRLADRHRRGERQQRAGLVEVAHHHRHQHRRPGRRHPRPALTPAAGGLLVGGDDRAVRRARVGQLLAPVGWSSRSAVVDARRADHDAGRDAQLVVGADRRARRRRRRG